MPGSADRSKKEGGSSGPPSFFPTAPADGLLTFPRTRTTPQERLVSVNQALQIAILGSEDDHPYGLESMSNSRDSAQIRQPFSLFDAALLQSDRDTEIRHEREECDRLTAPATVAILPLIGKNILLIEEIDRLQIGLEFEPSPFEIPG